MTHFIYPKWPVSHRVTACVTTRGGGVSLGCYQSLNLATHVGDASQQVLQNRALIKKELHLPSEPYWLDQVHGITVADSACSHLCQADAFYTQKKQAVGVVLTADCLSVFIANKKGTEVSVVHAGWKGLLNGVMEQAIQRFISPINDLCVWLGPAIGPDYFEVGVDVFDAFVEKDGFNHVSRFFKPQGADKWLADIYRIAKFRLNKLGIQQIFGGEYCTVRDQHLFYSYRREKITGRMASLIWIESDE